MKAPLLAAAVLGAAALTAHADTTVIHAGYLIAEPGKPMQTRKSLVIEDGRITAVRDGFVAGDTVVDLSSAYVMPGLIDMHTHITLRMNLADSQALFLRAAVNRTAPMLLQALPRLKAVLGNGFTTVRNLGDPANFTYDLRDAINRGVIEGPRILGSEPQFTVSGGDYDPFSFGAKPEAEPLFKNRGTCDGPIDCRRVVREEIHRGADVVKLRLATLAFIDPKIGAIEYQDEIHAIVETAHKLNRRVAAHVSGQPEGNRLVIEAGVDTVEHGPLARPEIDLMLKHGTAYTPTLLPMQLDEKNIAELKQMTGRDLYREAIDSAAYAHKIGVPILYGTDLGLMGPEQQAQEFKLLVEKAGLSAVDALRAATTNSAKALGLGDKLGTLEAGKLADIVAVRKNPLNDVTEMERVFFVMKGGKVFKHAGVGERR